MNTPNLVEHGIHTTKADYWIHLFPLEEPCRVYWYRVELMREFLRISKTPVTLGKSKDGTPTGARYLVRRDEFFVNSEVVPAWVVEGQFRSDMTDRELGFRGELVILSLLERRIVSVPVLFVTGLRSREDQFDSKDFQGTYFRDVSFETKTERVKSENLFVQSREGGHRVHLQTVDGQVRERFTDAPGFSGDRR
ncbi:MAG: hypothetical protein M9895_00230 [Aquamicrobium sp.]|uniref:hypothetical protein n=1 Tax=Aquamicrobium sp. TaxID=1872579 RepID=UPI00349EE910|nr:hypothetical protein [Aquamicrobium sp.]